MTIVMPRRPVARHKTRWTAFDATNGMAILPIPTAGVIHYQIPYHAFDVLYLEDSRGRCVR